MDEKPGDGAALTAVPDAGATAPKASTAAPIVDPIAVTPDMRLSREEKREPAAPAPRRRRRFRPVLVIAGVAALVGVASLAATAWTYSEMRREILRLSTDLAQVRLSLDLYSQRDMGAVAAPIAGNTDTAALEALQNRLAILEENWRNAASATPATTALPSLSGPTVAAQSDGDCLPSGMRLLVAAGDVYPVCGTDATVEVMNVSNGYITLTDGTTVASGGATPLVGTSCMIGVTSGGDEATTGFAEIRVSC